MSENSISGNYKFIRRREKYVNQYPFWIHTPKLEILKEIWRKPLKIANIFGALEYFLIDSGCRYHKTMFLSNRTKCVQHSKSSFPFNFLQIIQIWDTNSKWLPVYIYFPASDEFIVARNGVFRHLAFDLEKKFIQNGSLTKFFPPIYFFSYISEL